MCNCTRSINELNHIKAAVDVGKLGNTVLTDCRHSDGCDTKRFLAQNWQFLLLSWMYFAVLPLTAVTLFWFSLVNYLFLFI